MIYELDMQRCSCKCQCYCGIQDILCSVQSVDLSAEDLQQALRHLLSKRSQGATAWHCRLREAAAKAVELAESKLPTAAAALKEAADAVVVVQRFSVQVQLTFPLCPLFHLSQASFTTVFACCKGSICVLQ